MDEQIMKPAIPGTIRGALLLIGLLIVTSLSTQVMLVHAGQPVSWSGLMFWSIVYLALACGLLVGARTALWGGVLISVLQTLPAVMWTLPSSRATLGRGLPPWYSVPVFISLFLGLGLLLCLTTRGTRDYISRRRTNTKESAKLTFYVSRQPVVVNPSELASDPKVQEKKALILAELAKRR